jgi:hypothetical protein
MKTQQKINGSAAARKPDKSNASKSRRGHVLIHIETTSEMRERYRAAALRDNRSMSSWFRTLADRAVSDAEAKP